MTLQFTAEITVGAVSSTSVVAKILVGFRNCRDGEILDINQCKPCDRGTYASVSVSDAFGGTYYTVCAACPTAMDTCAVTANSIVTWAFDHSSVASSPCALPLVCEKSVVPVTHSERDRAGAATAKPLPPAATAKSNGIELNFIEDVQTDTATSADNHPTQKP